MAVKTHKTLELKLTAASSGNESGWSVQLASNDQDPIVEIGFFYGDKDTATHYGTISKQELLELLYEGKRG